VPTTFDLSVKGELLSQVLELLGQVPIPAGCSLFLRGGVLEECRPHPKSDIDLMVVGPQEESGPAAASIRTRLACLGRPVEAVPFESWQLARHVQIRMLVRCRSLQFSGPAVALPVLPVDSVLRQALWNCYAPCLLPPQLEGPVRQRLVTVKYLLRAVGVLGLFDGRYSRDLRTCLAWSKAYVPETQGLLEEAFASLEDADPQPLDIRDALYELEKAFVELSQAPLGLMAPFTLGQGLKKSKAV
jgi:hypothetical protein